MTRLWTLLTVWDCALLGICGSVALGQGAATIADSAGSAGRSAIAPPGCNGQIIHRIDVHAYPPFEEGGNRFVSRLVRFATSLHATTDTAVVRKFIPLKVGEPCETVRLREAERILRAQPFLADANLLVVPDGNDGVDIDVVTFDEVSLRLSGGVTSRSPVVRALGIGDDNVGGEAVSAGVAWENSRFRRDIFKARIVDYQMFARPYQLMVQGSRNEFGGSWDLLASHPFLTDLQRTSWRVSAGSWSGYRYFKRPDLPAAAMNFTRSYADAGGVRAFGHVGHIILLGGTISHERERTDPVPVIVFDSAVVVDTSAQLLGRYSEHRSTRLNLLVGFRRLSYMQVRAFDAVEGTQDVRTGFQLATLLGRGMKFRDNDERDYFMSTDLYYGHGTPESFAGIELMGERRRDMDTHKSDGVLASGRAAWYAHPGALHTSLIMAEYSGGWDQRVPFQLRMADHEGGLRGYGSSDLTGGRRMVMRFEDRYRLGHIRQLSAVAAALWVDAGRLWAGDAPFGVNTNVKYSAGIGLLAALPPRSRRTWRVDFAVPLNDRGDASFEVRFTNHDFTRWFWREPGDVQAARERAIPNSVYNWP